MEDQLSILNVLPADCFDEILSYLGIKDLFKFAMVCKTFKEIADDFCVFETNENVTTLTLTRSPVVISHWPAMDSTSYDPDVRIMKMILHDCVLLYREYEIFKHTQRDVNVYTDDLDVYMSIPNVYFEPHCDQWVNIDNRDVHAEAMQFHLNDNGIWEIIYFERMSVRAHMMLPIVTRCVNYIGEWMDYCRK